MSLVQLSLDTVCKLDPKAIKTFDRHLERIANDCYERPGDNKPRTITLKVVIVPMMSSSGECEKVDVQVQAESKVPPHTSLAFSCGLFPSGKIMFNEDAPDNFDQKTLDYRREDD